MQFQFGIEHEVAFLHATRVFADFTNTTFEMFDRIIQKLPYCDQDAGLGGNSRESIADRSGKSHAQPTGNPKVKTLLSLRQRPQL
jgi:hypothetical protein